MGCMVQLVRWREMSINIGAKPDQRVALFLLLLRKGLELLLRVASGLSRKPQALANLEATISGLSRKPQPWLNRSHDSRVKREATTLRECS
jgi:hypothetical protein